MARIKLTEYRAKSIVLEGAYNGTEIKNGSLAPEKGTYVVKVDQGIKKRFKKGLVALKVDADKIQEVIQPWVREGFGRFIAEPYVPHEESEEKYLSLERAREGIRILFADEGGINIEEHPEKIHTFLYQGSADLGHIAERTKLPILFLSHLVQKFEENYFAFLEINPLVVRGNDIFLLDAALLVDSAASFSKVSWTEQDVVEATAKHSAEEIIQKLQKTTPASLKLTVLNPNGSIFLLLSGGGGSIVIADEAALKDSAGILGNYGEYSGGPTREETYLYAKEILSLMLASNASKKALIIAGGIANFTDIKETFSGIIDALSEKAPDLRKQGIKVYVRRGGPNESAGLSLMQEYLESEQLQGGIHGSDAPITVAIDEALDYVKI